MSLGRVKLVEKTGVLLVGILLLSAGIKGWLLSSNLLPFNADEAVVGLMARHILAGERPVFFYGQAYMGSLDAFLVAIVYLIVGQQVWAIRLVQILLYLGTIYTTYTIGVDLFNAPLTGLVAASLVAFPTVNAVLYTTISLGGYGEALLIGNLLILNGVKVAREMDFILSKSGQPSIARKQIRYWVRFFLFGCFSGLGLWANGLTLVYLFPASLYILYYYVRKWRERSLVRSFAALFLILAGFFAGSFPWWSVAIHSGFTALIQELLGSAVAVEHGPWLSQFLSHLVNYLLLGVPAILGLRPPWEVMWLVLPMIPLVLFTWGTIAFFGVKRVWMVRSDRPKYFILIGIMLTLTAGFLATPFGVDPSGRYFLPFVVPMSLIAGDRILAVWGTRRWLSASFFIVILLYQLGGAVQSALNNPPGLTTQFDASTIIDHRYDGELIRFLEAQGETVGYTNYWTAYPIAFLSQEKVILIPRLPYHLDFRYTSRDDRYAPYDDLVARSRHVVYVTTRNPALDNRIREEFTLNLVQWREKKIGDYQLFYGLSKIIRPEQMNLGLIITQ